MVELCTVIEDEFGVELTDADLDGFAPDLPQPKSVSDLVRLVEGKLVGRVAA